MITEKQLQEWKELADNATPGPWKVEYDCDTFDDREIKWLWKIPKVCNLSEEETTDETAKFIAASREAVPALIAEIERLRELLQDVAG